jgi:hypothetical protein
MLRYLRRVVMLLVFNGCGYVMCIEMVCLCYGYLKVVVMLWVFRGCVYDMGF